MAINTELLLKVKEQILAEPELFDMGSFGYQTTCGTVCCIAGHAVALSGEDPTRRSTVEEMATELLRLTNEQANHLFFTSGWPMYFEGRYEEALDRQDEAQAAADYIDHFIATHSHGAE